MTTTAKEQPDQLTRTWTDPRGFLGWFMKVQNQPLGLRFIALTFTFFIIAGVDALFIRTQLARHSEREDGLLATTVRAEAFCHSMVRSLMGALVAVGEHRFAPDWVQSVLETAEREARVRVMPAHGLVLEEVVYPPDEALADRAAQARHLRKH